LRARSAWPGASRTVRSGLSAHSRAALQSRRRRAGCAALGRAFLRPRACILSSPAAATRQAERRSSGDAAAVGVRSAPGTAAPRWRRCSCVLRGLFVPLRRASAPVEVTRPLRAVGDGRSASALPTAASPSSAAARSPKRHFTHSSSTMLHTVDTGTHSESCGVLRASGRHASARAQTQKP
jgi:hypothetical protein